MGRNEGHQTKIKIAKEVVLAYPDFSKPFEIYTDASTMQLGAVITQDNRPIAFFSRKRLKCKVGTVTEIELLASRDTKGIQRHAVGAINQSLHRP